MMKYFWVILWVAAIHFLISISSCSSTSTYNQPSLLVIQNINVIDVEAGTVRHSQDVVVRDRMIVFVGDSFNGITNPRTSFIDGNGKYLMPGLWDMHFHLCWQNNNDSLLFPILLKNGITGIRDMGGDLNIMQAMKDRSRKESIQGPRIFGCGPMIDGDPPVQRDFSLPVDETTNMEKVLDSLKNKGADFFKTYSLIKENQLKDISAYCHHNKMSFAGHLSEYIEPEVSIKLGQKSIEHLNRLDETWQTNKGRIDSIGRLMVTHQTFLCPTLLTYQLKTRLRDSSIKKASYDPYIPAPLVKEWDLLWNKRIQRATKNEDWDRLHQVFVSQKQLVNHLHNMGVKLLAGSDFAGMPYVYPGISLHEELILLAESGLTNTEVIRTATINPAIFMSVQQRHGSIATGKFADLVILDKDPLEDIKNIHTIHSVFVNGKLVAGNNN